MKIITPLNKNLRAQLFRQSLKISNMKTQIKLWTKLSRLQLSRCQT